MKSLIRPIAVCKVCGSLYRAATNESPERFAKRKWCSKPCALIMGVKEQKIAGSRHRDQSPTTRNRRSRGTAPPRASPRDVVEMPIPERRRHPPLPVQELEPPPIPSPKQIETEYYTWEQAKYYGPSQWAMQAMRRYGQAMGLPIETVLVIFGYRAPKGEQS